MAERRSVLITGAAGGIGRAMCAEFAAQGWAVIGTDRNAADAVPCEAMLTTDLQELVSSAAARADFRKNLLDVLGRQSLVLHGLVNNAAIQELGGVVSLQPEQLRSTLDINVAAPLLLSQLVIDLLKQSKGAIVNVGSIHARLTKPGFVAYATSKAALAGLTRAMAVDLAGSVRVNCIEPAAIETDMLRAGFQDCPEQFHRLQEMHPSGRIGEPAEVAKLAAMLMDSGLGFINGETIGINGGIAGRLHDPE